jgi:excisionase family DNA binding protein
MSLLTKREAADFIGVHPEHLMRLAREGKFPPPLKLGDTDNSGVRFDQAEVDAWIEERKAARTA